ncbi:preprotein translocase, SecG subunit [gamma proteobacterium HTCC5015]|nr:preprotein translocase, SecG subunit [gamma proteobacterium HTCC5015]
METALLVVHVLLSIGLIALILIQHGKGADAGAAFGSGASGTVFGASGAGSFMTKLTTWIAVSFFATSLALAYTAANTSSEPTSVIERTMQQEQSGEEAAEQSTGDVPVAPASSDSDVPTAPAAE